MNKCSRCGADLTTGDCPNCGQLVIYSDMEGNEVNRGFLTGRVEEEHAHIWQKTMDLRWGSKPFQSIYDTMSFYEMKKVLEQRHICSCGAEKWEKV